MIASEGQNLFDLCVQGYGSLEALGTFLTDNNVSADKYITAGESYTITDSINKNATVQNFIIKNSLILNNEQPFIDASKIGDFNSDFSLDFYS